MEYEIEPTNQPGDVVSDYYHLVQNLSDEDKIALIAKISDSMVQNKKKKERKRKEKILAETYGCFLSDKSADELVAEIYNSRHFVDKNPRL